MDLSLEAIKELLRRTYQEFGEDNCPVLAGAVAYFGLLSVFPVLLLTLQTASWMLGSENRAKEALLELVRDFFPGTGATTESLIVSLVNSHGLIGWLALLGLVWAGSQVFFYLETATNHAWDCKPRPWWRSRVRSILLLLLSQVVMIAYLAISAASLFKAVVQHEWVAWLLWLSSFGISWVFFVGLNKFLPNCDVRWRAAVFGGIISAALFEFSRAAFRLYLKKVAAINLIYGSIGGLVILVIWAYYAALITMLGAEIASEVDEVFFDEMRVRHRRSRIDSEALELLRQAGIEAESPEELVE